LEFIEDLFQRDSKGKPFKDALYLGKLETMANIKRGVPKPVKFYLNAADVVNQHVLISAISGAGKTHVATVLIEELANKTNIPLVVFDPNSEYGSVGVAGEILDKLKVKKKIKNNEYPFDFKISKYSNNFSSKVSIIDSQGLDLEEKQTLFSSCLKSLIKKRVKDAIDPFIFIIEDVNFVASKTLKDLFMRSRKLGISTVLITQHPSEIDSRILSQMSTQIIGRTIHQQDLLCLSNMALDKTDVLPKLGVGEWIINGITMQGPTKVLIRQRYSQKLGI
jgi:DNA helicase HerA-like ATPase